MNYLEGGDRLKAENFMNECAKTAIKSECSRSKCGCIIVNDENIIGLGYNSPPGESQKRCGLNKDEIHKKVTDKTCCMHAEQRAIIDALKHNPSKIVGSKLYFIRLDDKDKISFAGKPYCTICSKMALDVSINQFILWHKNGICSYDAEEYNLISFSYQD